MYEYRARVASIHDADTARLDIDCGFSVWLNRVPFRLAGIDAPGLGKPGGTEARNWLRAMLPAGADLVVITQKDAKEKYGRYLATLYLPGDHVTSINRRLIEAGHARPSNGGAR